MCLGVSDFRRVRELMGWFVMCNKVKIKEVFAYYLPQFHEIEENNIWWGKGFTEWSLVKSAELYFSGHEKTLVGELGYYCLDDVSVIEKQYKIAKENSISTFAFWHYWFDDNDLLLNSPAESLLASKVDVRFCFAWANHSWFNKSKGLMLKEQKYDYDIAKHFQYLLPFFQDPRYTKIDNKPVIIVYNPSDAINCKAVIDVFDRLAIGNGFDGCYFIAENSSHAEVEIYGFDAFLNSCNFMRDRILFDKIIDFFKMKLNKIRPLFIRKYDYSERLKKYVDGLDEEHNEIPVVFPRWDSSIRHGRRGLVLTNATPDAFEKHLLHCLSKCKNMPEEKRLLMIKSWNEWGEGNYLEPCGIYGRSFLSIVKKHVEIL
jgi:hypothetical protein